MRHSVTASFRPAGRTALLAAMAVALLAASGCSWFGRDSLYDLSEDQRPLEVPPDLDLPQTTGAVQPAEPTSALRSETGAQQAASATTTAAAGGGFNVAMPRDQAFARVGDALAGVDGLEIATRAELLGAYDVSYMGSNFLVRVTAVDAGTYVSAVDPRGLPAQGEGPTTLLATLKAALGGQ